MRKKFFLLAAMMALTVSSAFAQMSSNVNHLNLAVGALYERGLDATISYEHETRYHHAWEYFANGYIQWAEDPDAGHVTKQSFWHNYFTYSIGIAYKPCVVRGRNHHGNLRIGVSGGCVPVSPDGHSRKRAIHHIDGIYKFKVLVQNI